MYLRSFFSSAIEISQPGHLCLVAPQLFKPTPAGKRRTAMPDDEPPQAGDRILLFRPENLSLLLQGQKVFDARKVNYRPGRYLLGCNGRIYGVAWFQRAFAVQTQRAWERLRLQHRAFEKTLPYAPKTFLFRVLVTKKLNKP